MDGGHFLCQSWTADKEQNGFTICLRDGEVWAYLIWTEEMQSLSPASHEELGKPLSLFVLHKAAVRRNVRDKNYLAPIGQEGL